MKFISVFKTEAGAEARPRPRGRGRNYQMAQDMAIPSTIDCEEIDVVGRL